MGIPVLVTPEELKTIRKELRKQNEVICLDETAYLKTLLVGRQLLVEGVWPVANVVKGYAGRTV